MGRGRAKRDGTHSSGPPPNARSGAWPAVIGLVVLALAAVALGGWAFRKWRDRRDRRSPAYPADEALAPSPD